MLNMFFSPLCPAAACPPMWSAQLSTRNHSMVESVLQMLLSSLLPSARSQRSSCRPTFSSPFSPRFGFYTPLHLPQPGFHPRPFPLNSPTNHYLWKAENREEDWLLNTLTPPHMIHAKTSVFVILLHCGPKRQYGLFFRRVDLCSYHNP